MWLFRNNQWVYTDNSEFERVFYFDPLIFEMGLGPWEDDPLGFGQRRKVEAVYHGAPNQHLGYEYHYSPVSGITRSWFECEAMSGVVLICN